MTNQEREKELKEKLYFFKQKIIGIITIVGTIFVCNSGLLYNEEIHGNDWSISFFLIPIGLIMIFSKDKCWMDDYFFECEAEDELADYYDYDEYDDEFDDYEEMGMMDILIAALEIFKNAALMVISFIEKYKISRPIR